jgi:serine/threonine-protein kinase
VAADRVGEVVADRYRLTASIGRGGMGAIYEAEHVITHKRFAVKTLLPGYGRIPEIAKRFEREARAASLLSHPNIVSVVDFGTLPDGALYLAMELVAGRSLTEVLEHESLPVPRVLAIVRQVLEALAHAHAAGVVHRDLKPDNIMLVDFGDERDVVKLLDFGIAKVVGDAAARVGAGETLTLAGIAFGTPDYMAPEQALGEPVDARADLYALGVIGYELLTGQPPFVSDDKVAVLRMHVAVSAPALDETRFTPELARVIARALAKRREDRFADAGEMMAALDAATAAQAEPGDAATPPAERPRSPITLPLALSGSADVASLPIASPRRRRLLLGLGVAAAVAAVLLAAIWEAGRPVPPPPVPAIAAPGTAVAVSWRLLGEARAMVGKDEAALAAYEKALTLGADADAALAANVQAWARSPRKSGAVRMRARELARVAGVSVDLLASYTADLERGPSCHERREAVQHLRALRDKRAVPVLKKAIGRHGGFLGLESINTCLDKDALEAIEFLNALP